MHSRGALSTRTRSHDGFAQRLQLARSIHLSSEDLEMLRDRRFFMMAVMFVTLFGVVNTAQAAWIICNQVAEDMVVSIAYIDPSGGFLSEGSWRLRACGGCVTVLQRTQTSDPNNVFFRAHGLDGFLIDGDHEFCVGESPYKLSNTNRCQKKGFRQIRVNLDKSWTTNITGKSSSGRRCYSD